MNANDLLALLPIVLIAITPVIVMMLVAFRRDYRLTVMLTVAGIILSALVLPLSYQSAPTQITPLIIMDQYAIFFIGLLFATGLIVTLFCYRYFENWKGQREELYILILTSLLGAAVLVASSHFATFLIGLETLSISLFALIAYPVKEKRVLEAAIKYLILSGTSSAFLLFGIALIYAQLGTLSFEQAGQLIADNPLDLIVVVGVTMVVAGLGFKLSLVPFHMWTSDVYQGAPAPVTAFVATVSKGAIFAFLLRYFITGAAYQYESLMTVFSIVAIASMLIGNLLALLQSNVKRVLAYSSIAHLGYLLVAFVAGSSIGAAFTVETVSFYLVAYLITTVGAFGIVSVLSTPEREAEMLDDFTGLFWQRPGLAFIFTAMLLSLAGIPLTIGFVGKFYLFAAGVDGGLWSLLVVLVIGSGIGLYYYLRIVLQMIKTPDATEAEEKSFIPISMVDNVTLSILAFLLIWLGVFPTSLVEMIKSMSTTLS